MKTTSCWICLIMIAFLIPPRFAHGSDKKVMKPEIGNGKNIEKSKLDSVDNSEVCKAQFDSLSNLQPPQILSIEFYDTTGKIVRDTDGWFILPKKVRIIVELSKNCSQVDFVETPTGTETYTEQKLIGIANTENNKAVFDWNVPTGGYLNVNAWDRRMCRQSELIKIGSSPPARLCTPRVNDTKIRENRVTLFRSV